MLKNIWRTDVNALEIMQTYICMGLLIVFSLIVILTFIRHFKKNSNVKKNTDKLLEKSSSVYTTIVIVWLVFSNTGIYSIYVNLKNSEIHYTFFMVVLLVLNTLFILYFWLNGTKDIIYTIAYYLNKSKIMAKEKLVLETELPKEYLNKKILLLYCTCNDFISESLSASMQQDYNNYETIILDDSSSEEYKKEIDDFAKKHKVKVIRRADRQGYKAGNINNFLQNTLNKEYDYFVLLDSDEIIPSDFIKKALKYFYVYENIGILQANHISTRNRTKFMERFHLGVNAHWSTYQSIKEKNGFLSFLGHGAMISKECYEDVGGFPTLVAEDISFTLEARLIGYYTAFANFIICEEEYPIDYFAFKKRHLKWTGGNLEFIKTFNNRILFSKELKWYEKLDVILFTYTLPMSSIFFVFLVINLMILPYTGYSAGYPIWLMIPTTIFLFAPTLNDMVYLLGKVNLVVYIRYLFSSFLLYGSMYWISFYGATKAWMGKKAVFIVTPKEETDYTLLEKIKGNTPEMIFSIVLMMVSVYFTHSFLPVILICIPSMSGMYLTALSSPTVKEEKK